PLLWWLLPHSTPPAGFWQGRRGVPARVGSALGHDLDREVLGDGVGEEARAHFLHTATRAGGVGRLDLEVQDLPDPELADLAEAEPFQRALHRRPLHVQYARLEPDEHARFHCCGTTLRYTS